MEQLKQSQKLRTGQVPKTMNNAKAVHAVD